MFQRCAADRSCDTFLDAANVYEANFILLETNFWRMNAEIHSSFSTSSSKRIKTLLYQITISVLYQVIRSQRGRPHIYS